MACLDREVIEQFGALIESSRALSSVLALTLASTPGGELSAGEIDVLTDLSYRIHLDLGRLEEVWSSQLSDQVTRGRS